MSTRPNCGYPPACDTAHPETADFCRSTVEAHKRHHVARGVFERYCAACRTERSMMRLRSGFGETASAGGSE